MSRESNEDEYSSKVSQVEGMKKSVTGAFGRKGLWKVIAWREAGANSDIYDAYGRQTSEDRDQTVALKMSKPDDKSKEALEQEIEIYSKLIAESSEKKRFPVMIEYGQFDELVTCYGKHPYDSWTSEKVSYYKKLSQDEKFFNQFREVPYLLMEKIPLSLAHLVCLAPPKVSNSKWNGFPGAFTVLLAVGCLKSIAAFHKLGFVHRHIVPGNFGVRLTNHKMPRDVESAVVIFDFGLSKRWPEVPRPVAPFVGSVRYASVNAHQYKEQGPVDDLWSLFYMMIEWLSAENKLPWGNEKRIDLARTSKERWTVRALCKRVAEHGHYSTDLEKIGCQLNKLTYVDEPRIEKLIELLLQAVEKNDCDIYDRNPSWIPFL